jgi:GWxTD domain-containing protein
MKKVLAVSLLFFTSLCLHGQVLRDQNYNYLYDPDLHFQFNWKIISTSEGYSVYYELILNDTLQSDSSLTLEWTLRNSLAERKGKPVETNPEILVKKKWKTEGVLRLTNVTVPFLAVKIENDAQKKMWAYYAQLDQAKSIHFVKDSRVITTNYVQKGKPLTINGFDQAKPLLISYYKDVFPAASPVFAVTQGAVSPTMKVDSSFKLSASSPVTFFQKGLYLTKHDDNAAHGFTFRVEDDYPKLGRLETLLGPLIYITTKDEYEKLLQAGTDKKKFDQVILGITGNSERAKSFMRSYFKRVEFANKRFTSYKEGWKTDRGMVYIIYGPPDVVYLSEGREVWEYRGERLSQRFQFVRSETIFDPNNFVLIRNKAFQRLWLEKVDLWRKARF